MEYKLPEKYLKNMQDLLKDEYQNYLDSFNEPSFNGLRINTNKISCDDFLKISPFTLKKVDWSHDGYYYFENDKPSKHPFYYAGLYYLQEPSAMSSAETLPIDENDYVLDVCAAPGGKSTEILNKLNGSGLLVANDISVSRSQALLKNIELTGNRNFYVTSESSNKLKNYFPKFFDKILIDAPCSGEGMFRKDNSLIKSWEIKGNDYYSEIQKEIVTDCLEMLKDEGMIVYSTCTFSPIEDEQIIDYLLSLDSSLQLVSMQKFFPHKIDGEGHFVALIKKNGLKTERDEIKHNSIILNDSIKDFLSHTTMNFDNGYFDIFNEKLYFLPNASFNTKRLRILRSGLLVGEIKKNGFEPSQAFAMALKKDEFDNVLDLDIEDNRVIKYLKGETISATNLKSGYCLVCVNGYSLGFIKVDSNVLKNKYEKGWRYQ